MSKPLPSMPADTWEHKKLWVRVKEALGALPVYFRSDTFIEGINATDIFTLNSALGATIENQVVDTLNQIRNVWDSEEKYLTHVFVRQPQSFPDVVLKNISDESATPILGIELKGWYLLAKEGEPSLRFTQNFQACSDADLIMVVPWVLSNVISGRPKISTSFIESAKYVAQFRNYHWQHMREAKTDSSIELPKGPITPYPSKADATTDSPKSDKGGNFGRIARTGIMDEYIKRVKSIPVCGIKAHYWLEFFKMFHEGSTEKQIAEALQNLKKRISAESSALPSDRKEVLNILYAIEQLVNKY